MWEVECGEEGWIEGEWDCISAFVWDASKGVEVEGTFSRFEVSECVVCAPHVQIEF